MSDLSGALRVFSGKIVNYTNKQGQPDSFCSAATLADYDEADNSIGCGFIEESFPNDNNHLLIKRLQSDIRQASMKGFDYILIVPHYKRIARGRGQAQSVVGDYELVGYGKLTDSSLESVQVKQPVKS
ncbi:hypothetical protein CE665_25510 [Salmonella enterica subsp. enterica serovar Poona]|nr:hypothetical protein [Salmonella enterica subsp. enterica serovar Poona]